MNTMDYWTHSTALVGPGASIGAGTRVWAFCNILDGAIIGKECQICDHVFIEGGAVVGDRVTVKCGVSIWDGIQIGDDVFIGPGVMFTNDPTPRSGRHLARYPVSSIGRYASLGAGAIVLPGITIGEYAMVGAGALLTHDVPAFALVRGHPAQVVGAVCACGESLTIEGGHGRCGACGHRYTLEGGRVIPVGGLPELPRTRRT